MSMNYELIEAFRETIKKGDLKKYIDANYELSLDSDIEVYKSAIMQGYLDACRTFKNGKRLDKEDERIVACAWEIKNYLDSKSATFDHHKYCMILVGADQLMTYGQAQKIINMAFKYLRCLLPNALRNPMEERFDECHLPLDGIMLEWISRNITGFEKSKMSAWSNLKYSDDSEDEIDGKYTYNYYAHAVNDYCFSKGKTPLMLDFENWKIMALTIAAEEFLKAIASYGPENNLEMDELVESIKRIL